MNETRIAQIENILDQLINVSANQETTKIVPNAEVIDADPYWITDSYWITGDYIIVEDDTGHYIPALKIPGLYYTDGDNVNLLIMKGTEPIAFEHGSSSSGVMGGLDILDIHFFS